MTGLIYGEEYNTHTPTNHNKYLNINNYKPKNIDIYQNFSDGSDQTFLEEENCGEIATNSLQKGNNIIISNNGNYQSFPEDKICCAS